MYDSRVCAGIVQRSTVQCGTEEKKNQGGKKNPKVLSRSSDSDLCNFFTNNDWVFFPDFLSTVSFIVKGAIMDVRVSVNTTEHISTAAVKT